MWGAFQNIQNIKVEFFCPLCGTKRGLTSSSRLGAKNYFQILLGAVFLAVLFYPLVKERAFFLILPILPFFEWVHGATLRNQIPCPHCGFDAVWYRRDVRVARKKVEEFWREKGKIG